MRVCCTNWISCESEWGFPQPNGWPLSQQHPDLVAHRDDLTVEVITLLNQTSQPQKALTLLSSRRFNPWEGGEGLVSGQYVWAHFLLGRSRLERGQAEEALKRFADAREYPHNLGEGKHLLTPETHLDYFAGVALSQLGREQEALQCWSKAVENKAPITWMNYYQALSYRALGRGAEAKRTLEVMRTFAERQMKAEVKIDYFATSLPNFLLFEDDLQKRNQIDCLFILALAELGEDNLERAAALFKRVLAMDRNHLAAQEELRCLSEISGELAEAL